MPSMQAERPRLPFDIERTVFETVAQDHLQSGGTPGGLVNLRLVAYRVREWWVRLSCCVSSTIESFKLDSSLIY